MVLAFDAVGWREDPGRGLSPEVCSLEPVYWIFYTPGTQTWRWQAGQA